MRQARGIARRALGEAVGYRGESAYQTVYEWERGIRGIAGDQVSDLAAALGVTVAELYGEEPGPLRTSNVEQLVDVQRLEAAGIPIYAWATLGPIAGPGAAEPLDWEPFPEDIEDLGPRGIGVRVRGRSMANRGIEPGSTCFVDPQRGAQPGDVVLARAWSLDGSEVGMVVKVLANSGSALESDGDEGAESFAASRFELIGPVVSTRPPSRRPLTGHESTRRRSDARDRQSVDDLVSAISHLPALDRRALLARLGLSVDEASA